MKQQETMTSNNVASAEWELPVLEEVDLALITENGTTIFGSDGVTFS
jgi:hypothetical protein